MFGLNLSIILLFLILPLVSELTAQETRGYFIGPGDLLDLSVYPDTALNRTLAVRDDGTILVPLVGPIPVSGVTALEAAERIRLALAGGYYKEPQVEVRVKSAVYNRVFVVGAVRSPGFYPILHGEGFREMFARIGGLEKEASGGLIILDDSGAVTATHVDLLFSSEVSLPLLKRGMILYFPAHQGVYVMGEVRSPGKFPFIEGLTLLRALSLAGGFSPRAQTHKVIILRSRQRIEVDADAIVDEKRDDPLLKVGDLVFVPERFF